jgi:hypothetical protein
MSHTEYSSAWQQAVLVFHVVPAAITHADNFAVATGREAWRRRGSAAVFGMGHMLGGQLKTKDKRMADLSGLVKHLSRGDVAF